ncbi:RWD domain-containing protein 4, partial [Lampetra fluviatilis]
VGDPGSPDSFVVEVQWGDQYPESEPNICLGAFYNHHLSPTAKEKICGLLKAEACLSPGSAVTFSVFEAAKEAYTKMAAGDWAWGSGGATQEAKTAPVEKVRKEQLTKSQKRRLINTTDHKGEKIRGWDWIDVIK